MGAKVLVLYTGGTFGMDEGRRLPKLSAPALKKRMLQFVPRLGEIARCEVEILLNRDSAHVGAPEWIRMAERIKETWDKYDGVVVLHGTDTLAYTGAALSFLLRPCRKPVILTGAQKPLAALRTDARRNLVSAVEIAVGGPRPLVNQVAVFFDDRLFQANRIRKRSAADFEAFESPKAPALALVGTDIRYRETDVTRPRYGGTLNPTFHPDVAMIHLTPGFPAKAFELGMLDRVAGLVFVVFPSGTGPTHSPDFVHLLRAAKKKGVPVVLVNESVSETPSGSGIDPRSYEAGAKMLEEGATWAGELTPECAFVKLSLILGQPQGVREFPTLWRQDLASEGSPI